MEFENKKLRSVAEAAARIMMGEKALHPNQQKLDVHEPEKDKLTSHDFKKLRSMKKEETMHEESCDCGDCPSDKGMKKEEVDLEEARSTNLHAGGVGNEVHMSKFMQDHTKKNKLTGITDAWNEYHGKGTVTHLGKDGHVKVKSHDTGKIHKFSYYGKGIGHDSEDMTVHRNKNDIHILRNVKEEVELDEAPLRAVDSVMGHPNLDRKIPAKGTPGSSEERNKAAAGLKRDRSGLGSRMYPGNQQYGVRREEVDLEESKMAQLDSDLKDLSHDEFTKEYGKPKHHYDPSNFKKPVQKGQEMNRAKALAQRAMASMRKEEVDLEEGKWNYPPEYTKKANADDEDELKVSLINKDARKSWRKKVKAKDHKALMTGMKKEEYELTLEDYSLEELEEFMISEEFEQLDEISKKTLGSYVKKSHTQSSQNSHYIGMGNNDPETRGKAIRSMNKRTKGIRKAVDRLTKEDVEEGYVSEMDHGGGKNPYAGHGLSNDDDDGKKEYQAKPVSRKTVSKLALQFLNKNLDTKNKKVTKEEVEEIEEMFPGTPEYEKKYGKAPQDMKRGEKKKTTQGEMEKTGKGVVHRRKFSEMVESYTEGGVKGLFRTLNEAHESKSWRVETSWRKSDPEDTRSGSERSKALSASAARKANSPIKDKDFKEEYDLEDFTPEELEEFMQTEEYEQLDELSRETLWQYWMKANPWVVTHKSVASAARKAAAAITDPNDHYGAKDLRMKARGHSMIAKKRDAGIKKVNARLAVDADKHYYENHWKVNRGYWGPEKPGHVVPWTPGKHPLQKEGVDLTLEDFTPEELEEFMQTEEYEQLDELSKDTLKSYIPAAARDLSKKGIEAGINVKSGKRGVTKEYGDHFQKRYTGIIKATRKLAKESYEEQTHTTVSFVDYNDVNDVRYSEIVLEGRPSQRHPLEGHEYHKKSNEALIHIAKDAHKAAEAMKSHNTTAENKYRDQASDSATVRYFRQKNGMPEWYKKMYGHTK